MNHISFNTEPFRASYPLPSDFLMLHRVEIVVPDEHLLFEAKPFNEEEPPPPHGGGVFYRLEGESIRFFPAPPAGRQEIILYYDHR
jgi:hypothetical protein